MLQSLRSTLAWLGLTIEPPDNSPAAPGDDLDAVLRFEQLVGELHLAALQTAVVTSGINALGAGIAINNPLELEGLAPQTPDPGSIGLSRRCREEVGVQFRNVMAARDFFVALKPASRELESFCADIGQFGAGEAAFLDVAGLAATWRAVSLRALGAVVALEPDVRRCLTQSYAGNTPELKRLLRSVIEGGQPCVDPERNVVLPDLPQRRAALRPNVRLPCTLEHQGRTTRAIVKDISTGGAGLDGAPGLVPQTVVLIEFEGGPCLAGLVVWSKGARAGVKFDVPLKAGHPLLAAEAGGRAEHAHQA